MTFSKDELSSLVAVWGRIEDVATAIVLLGVVGEFVSELTSWIKSCRWKHRTVVVSTLAVIAGIAGELAAQHRLSDFNGQLQAVTELEAKNAEKDASKANERAATIEALAKWRTLEQDQIDRLISALGASKHTIQVAYMKDDQESLYFARQIETAAHQAGWEYGSWAVHFNGLIVAGLIVVDKPENDAVHALEDALHAADIGFDPMPMIGKDGYEGDGGYHEAEVTLVVGSRMPPRFKDAEVK